MKSHRDLNYASVRALAIVGFLLMTLELFGQETHTLKIGSLGAPEKDACAKKLTRIHEAIQEYRKEHHQLPNWLSDLVPKYLPDFDALTCPALAVGNTNSNGLSTGDPRFPNAYTYQFSDGPLDMSEHAGSMKNRELRRLQMAVVGGTIPLVRCLRHQPTLNISFDGQLLESPLSWETLYSDIIRPEDLQPSRLLARFTNAPVETMIAATSKKDAAAAVKAEPMSMLGRSGPNFELELLDGGLFELESQKGKNVVILDFWATWCGPCRAALPGLVELSEQYRNRGVLLRGVDLRESSETIHAYLEKSKLPLTVLLDKDGTVAEMYRVGGIPQTVIIGKDGKVQAVHVGYSKNGTEELRRELDDVLGGKEPARDN